MQPGHFDVIPPKFEYEAIDLEFAPVEARYIRLQIESSEPGTISGLGLMGATTVMDTSSKPLPKETSTDTAEAVREVPYDYANLHNGSFISHISSDKTEGAHAMIDDDITSGYQFPPDHLEAVFLVDLQQTANPNELTILFDSGKGEVRIYAFNALPEELARQETEDGSSDINPVILPDSFWTEREPLMSFATEGNERLIRYAFDKRPMRYVLVRWLGDPGDAGGTGSASAGGSPKPLTIYEINVMGRIPEEFAMVDYLPQFEFADPGAGIPEADSLLAPITPDVLDTQPILSP